MDRLVPGRYVITDPFAEGPGVLDDAAVPVSRSPITAVGD